MVILSGISILILEPNGTKTSRTGIPINYIVGGNNLTCWYNVLTSIDGEVIANTTLTSCDNSSFSVSNDGDYIFWLFVNNSLGTESNSNSTFSVDTSSSSSSSSSSGSSGGSSSSSSGGVVKSKSSLEARNINGFIVNKGGIKKILNWKVKNNGIGFLNDCAFSSIGEYSSWTTYFETRGLAEGEEYTFVFDVNIPEDISPGNYTLGVYLDCQETNVSKDFVIGIVERTLDFLLLDVSRDSDESVKVKYSIGDISGEDQDVSLQFLLFDLDGKQIVEVNESKNIKANSKNEFEIFIPINKDLEGELNLLANLNSESFSTFVQESVFLGSTISGFTIFDRVGGTDNIIIVILVILFLSFAFFVIRKIRTHKVRAVFKHRVIKRKK